jgi:hypothetical protein
MPILSLIGQYAAKSDWKKAFSKVQDEADKGRFDKKILTVVAFMDLIPLLTDSNR